MAALRRLAHHVLRRRPRRELRHLPAAGTSALQPAASSRRDPGPGLEYLGVLRDQHELAGLRGRDDDVLPVPDGRAGRAELRQRRGRDRGRGGSHPRILPPRREDHRELLGRPGPRHDLHPAAHRVRGRDHLRGPGRAPDAERAGAHPRRAQRSEPGHPARPGGLAGGHQAARHQRRRFLQRQRRGSVREPDRADQLPLDRAHLASRSASPTPSARWRAVPVRARPSWA